MHVIKSVIPRFLSILLVSCIKSEHKELPLIYTTWRYPWRFLDCFISGV